MFSVKLVISKKKILNIVVIMTKLVELTLHAKVQKKCHSKPIFIHN